VTKDNAMSQAEEQVITIKSPLFHSDVAVIVQQIMHTHGGNVAIHQDHCVFTFPIGTTRIEQWPRVDNSRYTIIFPDRYTIQEIVTRNGICLLHFPHSEFL
jgi:hypothetical protein